MTAAQPKRTWPGGGFKHLSMISPDRCHGENTLPVYLYVFREF